MKASVPNAAKQAVGMDIEAIRRDTPGASECIHLNNAGAGLMPRCVVSAITDHIKLEARIGGYEAKDLRSERLEMLYSELGSLIGADASEIAITENATTAWSHAFYSVPLKPGDRILTSEAEYAANFVAFLQQARRTEAVVEIIPSDEAGSLDVEALERMIDDRVALIAITWIPTNGGLVNPARKIGEVAKRHGVPYLLDACQAIGQMPVDVEELGCDFLSATGRKFLRGPRGIGFLYVRRSRLDASEPMMIDHYGAPWVAGDKYCLRDDARRFETWENAYALRLGLSEAVRYALDLGLPAIQERAWVLGDILRMTLAEIPGVKDWDIGRDKCAIVSFSMEGKNPEIVVEQLRGQGINVSTSVPSSTLIDAQVRSLPPLLRASPHYYNTEGEIEAFTSALARI